MNRSVAILMAVRNGQEYLQPQLDSFLNQTYKNWCLYVSDDGSTDSTAEIVNNFYLSHPEISGFLKKGPCLGFCQNFQSMINDEKIIADYYAFSDQDDIWLPEKIENAVRFLDSVPSDTPALYCSATTLIDQADNIIGESLSPTKALSFANALLHNVASGNTMVFNHKARELLMAASTEEMVVHDWSLYQIVSACNGRIYFDRTPGGLYRQHSNNVVGDGRNIFLRVRNFFSSFKGNRADWNKRNKTVLDKIVVHFGENEKQVYYNYNNISKSNFLKRIYFYIKSGVYHQYKLGTLSTIIYVCVGKM